MQNPTDATKLEMIIQGYARSKQNFPEVQDISATDLRDRSEHEDLVVVDVRSPAERAVSMIKGAISSAEFEQNRDQYKDSTVVTYCTIGHRSGLYAKKLQAEGTRVLNLAGSVLSWSHAGGAFEDENGATQRVHVGGPSFNLIAADHEPTW